MSENNITVVAIAALGNQRQIGKDNQLLWHIPEDLKRFKQLTDNKAVIMGRRTWESLPDKSRPLPNRENIVLTRRPDYEARGAVVKNSLKEALDYARGWSKENKQTEIFIIGGEAIYKQALPETDRLYLTLIDSDKNGDTFFPEYKNNFEITNKTVNQESEPGYTFLVMKRK